MKFHGSYWVIKQFRDKFVKLEWDWKTENGIWIDVYQLKDWPIFRWIKFFLCLLFQFRRKIPLCTILLGLTITKWCISSQQFNFKKLSFKLYWFWNKRYMFIQPDEYFWYTMQLWKYMYNVSKNNSPKLKFLYYPNINV